MAAREVLRKLLQGKATRLQSLGQKQSLSPLAALSAVGAGASAGFLSLAAVASASDEAGDGMACPRYPWPHDGVLSSTDPLIQRGQKVFMSDCAACHSMLPHRNLNDAAYAADDEVKAAAAEIVVVDALPNDENEQPAMPLGGGPYLADRTLITKIQEGLHSNLYSPVGAIVKSKVFTDGAALSEELKRALLSPMWLHLCPM